MGGRGNRTRQEEGKEEEKNCMLGRGRNKEIQRKTQGDRKNK